MYSHTFWPDAGLAEDEHAFARLVHTHSSILFSIAFRITRNRQVAEDIVQEAFLRLWQDRFDITPGNLGGWLHRVVVNLGYKHVKKINRHLQLMHALEAVKDEYHREVEEQMMNKENGQLLQQVLNRLSKMQRAVYHLSREEGLSRNEIAQQLNMSPNTVKVHMTRALNFMREHLMSLSIFCVLFVFNNFIFQTSNTNARSGDLYNTGRSIHPAVPHPKKIDGVLLNMHYDLKNRKPLSQIQ